MNYIEYNETDIQSFEYETTMVSDGNIIGTCELGKAKIQMLNDSNEYSSLKESWIQTVHGSFYIYDVAPVQEKVNIKLSCYDIKYKLDKPYDSSKHKFPCTLKTWRNSIFDDCEVTYDDSDFPNSDLILKEEPYIENGSSNRQVIQVIAQAGASAVVTDENDCFYFKWFEDIIHIVEDWTELTTEKESSIPVNTIVLGRGNTEDNVYYPEQEATNKVEFRIDNNYILDPQDTASTQDRRYQTRIPIYNQVNNFSYLIFNMRTQNIENKLSVKLGQKIKYLDIYDNELIAYIMSKKITYLGGNMLDDDNYEITLSAEKINETSTDLSYGSSVINDILRVERKADKNKGLIEDTIEKQGTQQNQITQISQTVDTIQQQVSGEYGMDREVTGTNQVFIEDAMKYYPLELKVSGYSDLSGLIYPSANLYPNATLYPRAYHEPALNTETTVQTETQNTSQSAQGAQKIIVGPTVITATTTKEPSTQTSGNVKVTVTVNKSVEPEPLKATGWTLSDNNTVLKKTFSENTTEVLHLIDASDSSKTKDYTIVIDNIIPAYLTLCVDSQDREHPTENLKEYKIVIDKPLRSLGTLKDELSIVLDEGELKAQITRYLGYTGSQIVKLDKPTTDVITCPTIELLEHSNYVYIKEQPNYQIYIKYLVYSTMNRFYATKVELETTRKQTEDSIIDTVSATYSTKKELAQEKSEILQTVDSITSTVSQTYATKDELTTTQSTIKQTIDSISTEVSKKVGNDEIKSKINQSAEAVKIEAKNLDLTGLVTITDLNTAGKTIINGSNITTGIISADRVTGGTLKGTIIEGNTIKGGTISGTTINTDKDLTVGNNVYVGQNQSGSGIDIKNIYFSENSRITRMTINNNTEAISLIGKDFSSISTDGGVLQANSYGVSASVLNSSGGMSHVFDIDKNGFAIHNGDFTCQISGSSNGIYMSHSPTYGSDKRLKKKIKNLDVSWIDNLKVKEFEYKNTPDKKQIGLIAQDYVDTDYSKYFLNQKADGYYGINYGNITNALIQYCQELKKEIVDLRKEIEVLKNER